MNYVLGAATGLLWGAVIAFINMQINKRALVKNSTKAVMTANACRMGLDLVGLGSVFLLRKVLPFSFEATIVGTAVSLGLLTVVFAFRLVRPESKRGTGEQNGPEEGERNG